MPEIQLEELQKKCNDFWKVLAACNYSNDAEKEKAFCELGISPTPRKTLYQENSLCVYHYESLNPTGLPLLIVPSLINRNYILDLLSGHSVIQALVNSGVSCYLIDWGTPGVEHAEITLDDYLDTYIHRAVKRVLRHSGKSRLHLMGQCIGGIMASIYAAKYSKDSLLASLTLLTTPINMEHGGKLSLWMDPRHFNLDLTINSFKRQGFVPPEVLHSGFPFLDVKMMFDKYRNLFNFSDNAAFVQLYRALDFWSRDNVPFPCEVLRKFIREIYQKNSFYHEQMEIGGQKTGPSFINIPVHNLIARYDHVMPVEASAGWRKNGHPKDRETIYDGGHVTIIAGLPLRFQVYQDLVGFFKTTGD
ncbi:MAG: alpha/beta fold hydrolase [Candidatus Wallbacteria bacterium]|nr:alpha/beta fold hydrolase [Candidatus Wallbacteria bacterium]